MKQQARRNKRQLEADGRQLKYDDLSLEQKMANAVGKKEKAKIQAKIAKRDEKKPATSPKTKTK